MTENQSLSALLEEMIEQAATLRMSSSDAVKKDLHMLSALAELSRGWDRLLGAAKVAIVGRLREQHVEWPLIANALGMSVENAWDRYLAGLKAKPDEAQSDLVPMTVEEAARRLGIRRRPIDTLIQRTPDAPWLVVQGETSGGRPKRRVIFPLLPKSLTKK